MKKQNVKKKWKSLLFIMYPLSNEGQIVAIILKIQWKTVPGWESGMDKVMESSSPFCSQVC